MVVRVARMSAPGRDEIAAGLSFAFDRLVPFFQEADGFVEAHVLVDEDGGGGLLLTYWEDAASADAAEARLAPLRRQGAKIGLETADVHCYGLALVAGKDGRIRERPSVTTE